MREWLKAHPKDERDKKSRMISAKLRKDDTFRNAKIIMVYLATDEEVETRDLVSHLFAKGKRVAVPCVDKNVGEIKASFIHDLENDLTEGSYGILEPKKDKMVPVKTTDIDLVLVPGLAFDQAKYRLGRGKGYYDRFLAKLPHRIKTFGLAFDFQMVRELPVTELDIPMTRVVHS